jgi:hypothetical protein
MQYVTVTPKHARYLAIVLSLILSERGWSQINSPYSRFGLGDLYNSRNVVNKGMGSLATPYADYQSVNFINPASLSNLQTVTFDVGIETEFRSLLNESRTQRSQSANMLVNYVAVGIPLAKDKKGSTNWGLAFGLRPYTRVNYNLFENGRLPNIDSVRNFYEGSGGLYRAFLSTGYRIGNFSVGINAGFLFGQQDIASRRTWVNDTTFYMSSNHVTNTSYQKFAFDGGFQYKQKLGKKLIARIGATGFMGNTINAKQDVLRETFIFDVDGGLDSVDVVYRENNLPSEITMPAGYTAGLIIEEENKWLLGVEYENIYWDDFKINGLKGPVANSHQWRFGGQFIPSVTDAKRYLRRVTYRAGFFTGKDYVVVNGVQLPVWGITAGVGLPVRRWNVYSNQFTNINLSFEYGSRGNDQVPLKENLFRVNAGLSLSDIWFIKRKYN